MKIIKIILAITSLLLVTLCIGTWKVADFFESHSENPTSAAERIQKYDERADRYADKTQPLDRDEIVSFVKAMKKVDSGGEQMIQGAVQIHGGLAHIITTLVVLHLATLCVYLKKQK